MKHGSNPRRGRSRGNGKRHVPLKNQNFESNGPDVKVRGTAKQVWEKYLNLARDATSAGDRIMAESYFQYAEHYFRILNADRAERQGQGQGQGQNGPNGKDRRRQDGQGEEAQQPQQQQKEIAAAPAVDIPAEQPVIPDNAKVPELELEPA